MLFEAAAMNFVFRFFVLPSKSLCASGTTPYKTYFLNVGFTFNSAAASACSPSEAALLALFLNILALFPASDNDTHASNSSICFRCLFVTGNALNFFLLLISLFLLSTISSINRSIFCKSVCDIVLRKGTPEYSSSPLSSRPIRGQVDVVLVAARSDTSLSSLVSSGSKNSLFLPSYFPLKSPPSSSFVWSKNPLAATNCPLRF
mmetsp:Transcript_4849/g.14438  ORF Transcript_4849/g.14438 Transcript_4849/m.14438 type:complete len:204 (-) Transcript_4849:186-797(-)